MKHIDKVFKERLFNREMEVPEGMWEKIAPTIEEESGRGLIWWLWVAGIIALGIAGIFLFFTLSSDDKKVADPGTLVLLEEHPISSISKSHSEATDVFDMNPDLHREGVEAKVESDQVLDKDLTSKEKISPAKSNIKTTTRSDKARKLNNSHNNYLQNSQTLPKVSGTPANLVITKSYISENGSIVTQSSLNGNSEAGPSYEVIINSEATDMNAGTLLRLVEPIQEIPLPSFEKLLKKKMINPSM